MKRTFLTILVLSVPCSFTYACTTCDRSLQAAIYNSTFFPNLVSMLWTFIALIIIVIFLWIAGVCAHARRKIGHRILATPVPLVTSTMILGMGLGGFIDGIIFHQVLQWHEMLSNKLPPDTLLSKSVNMFWDGIFHLLCLVTTIAGITMLWNLQFRKDVEISTRLFMAGNLLGWGIFNIVEGILDHHVFKLHNVRDKAINPGMWNYLFLAASTLMVIVAVIMIVTRKRHSSAKQGQVMALVSR